MHYAFWNYLGRLAGSAPLTFKRAAAQLALIAARNAKPSSANMRTQAPLSCGRVEAPA
jgi:hypothetical protein